MKIKIWRKIIDKIDNDGLKKIEERLLMELTEKNEEVWELWQENIFPILIPRKQMI